MRTEDAVATMSFNGVQIHDQGEMLSLTDMWAAAGGNPSQRPVEWLRSKTVERFIQFLAEDLGIGEVGKSHFGLVSVSRGGETKGSTFAHWQLAMSYAKYLSPAFHAWCNKVVRERMEGRVVSASVIDPATLEMIRRSDGILRMLASKVTGVEASVAKLPEALAALIVG